MNLSLALLIAMGINLIMFIPAYVLKTDKLTDISYALTFATLALVGLLSGEVSVPHIAIASMVFLWALRIGSYLLVRIKKMGRDKRFDDIRNKFFSFAGFWILQGFTVWIVMIPAVLFLNTPNPTLTTLSYTGIAVWILGLGIETIADLQKYRFINNPKNKGKWIASGMWKYSRHPNYFGEITLWTGVYITTIASLTPLQATLGILSPIYIACLIIFVSGLPMLEKEADKRWGSDKKYKEYKAQTSILIPLPPRKK